MKLNIRTARGAAAMAFILALPACEGATTKATDERLATLLSNGLDAEKAAKVDQRLEATLNKDNGTGALKPKFAALSSGNGVDLNALTVAALERNSRIGTAAQGINLQDANRLNAIFGYLPQVSIGYQLDQVQQEVIDTDNAVFQLGDADFPVTSISATVTQPIFDLSRIFGIQFANNARSQAEIEYVKTVRDVSYEVLDAYLVASQASVRAESLRQRQSMLSRQLTVQSALAEEGLDVNASVSSLRSERASIGSEEALEQARFEQALSDLSLLTGHVLQGVARLQVPSGIRGVERRVSADDGVASGLRDNPLIMSAALDVVGTELQRRESMASDFSPVLNAYATLEREDREASRFGGGSLTQDTTIGLSLTIPIFNASGQGIATLPATVNVRQAALEYYATQRQLETQIRATHARLTQLERAVSQAGTAVSAANRALSEERRRVDAGESTDLAVVSRQLRSNTARERQTYQQLEYVRAWARFQYLTGVSSDLLTGR